MLFALFELPEQPLLLDATYDPSLVFLSLVVAILSSCAALFSVEISRQDLVFWQRQLAILAGTFSLGIGIWSMHFIGMLAFALCTPVQYSATITFFSLFPSLLASWVALNLLRQSQLTFQQLLVGGVLVGAGIGAMHYSGMAAMQMAAQLRYDPVFFALSIVVAVGMAFLALWIRFGIQSLQNILSSWQLILLSGLVMGLAISAMHYTGMLAARFVAPQDFSASAEDGSSAFMALVVTSVTVTVTLLVLLLQVLLKFYQAKRVTESYATRLGTIMDTVLDAIITINQHGIIVAFNEASRTLLETNDNLIGVHFARFLHSDQVNEYLTLLNENSKKQDIDVKGARRKLTVMTARGKQVPVRLALSLTRLDSELLYVACLSDISAQHSFEQSLKQSEQKFRSLIQNIPGAAYRCLNDAQWSMLFISERVEALCGYPASDFMLPAPRRHWASLIIPADLQHIKHATAAASFSIEYRITHADGSVRWMLEHGETLKDEQGNETMLDGFIMDITSRRQMEEQLREAKRQAEQASEVKSAFLANMSHEIRTPLNAVIGFTELLRENPHASDATRYLDTVHHSARSLLSLLNDILDSAKLERGKLELEAIHFSLTGLIDQVISTLWVQAKRKQLTLSFDIATDLAPYYVGAEDRIRQVLLNIVGNAIKFTERGHVTLNVQQAAGQLQFTVSDTGIGIAPERLNRIFEPFVQADASMSRRFGGTGLGTTISKQLVELMGGHITATSTPGQGSTFTITLPLPPGKPVEGVTGRLKLPPLTVLIADDIPQNVELLTAILQRDHHQVIAVQNGAEVLEKLAETTPDLVLMDVQMPVMDGLSAAMARRAWEQQQQLARIPIIAITASAQQEDRQAVIDAGMDGFATKPIDISALNHEIARVLGLVLEDVEHSAPVPTTAVTLIAAQQGISLWGSETRFASELQRFAASSLATLCHALRQAQHPEDLSRLQQIAHRYKGLSANLALSQLAVACGNVERVAKKADDAAAIDTSINDLCQVAENTLAAIAAYHPITITPAGMPDVVLLPGLLRQLQTQLAVHDYDDTLVRQVQRYENSTSAAGIGVLLQQIDAFKFSEAIETIGQLLANLES